MHGSAKELKVTATTGKVVIEKSAVVVDITASAGASVTSAGTVLNNTAAVAGISVATEHAVSSAADLASLRDYVNAGVEFSVPIEIKADIDISNMSWTPMGTKENPFHGTIHGNNHAIKGLTNGVLQSFEISIGSTTGTMGSVYGLIGYAGKDTVEITNLRLTEVNIDLEQGAYVGALIGFAASSDKLASGVVACKSVTLTNVTVGGNVIADTEVGGLVGRMYNTGNITITNCTNNANVKARCANNHTGRAAGLVGYIGYGKEAENNYEGRTITFTNCTNNGKVEIENATASYIAGIAVTGWSSAQLTVWHYNVSGCSNNNEVKDNHGTSYAAHIIANVHGARKTGSTATYENNTIGASGKLVVNNIERDTLVYDLTNN